MKEGEWIRVDRTNFAIEVFIESRDLPNIMGADWKAKQSVATSLMEVDTYPREYFRFIPKTDEGDIEAGRFASPKSSPSVNLVEIADALMLKSHGDQTYGDLPYAVHPRAVKTTLIEEFKHCFAKIDMKILACGGLLHDVVEDSDVTYREVSRIFGSRIGRVVYSVTNENGLTPFHRIKKLRLATAVKLADRIMNLRSCFIDPEKTKRLMNKYHKSHERFYHELCETSKWGLKSKLAPMWVEYLSLIEKAGEYLNEQ